MTNKPLDLGAIEARQQRTPLDNAIIGELIYADIPWLVSIVRELVGEKRTLIARVRELEHKIIEMDLYAAGLEAGIRMREGKDPPQ